MLRPEVPGAGFIGRGWWNEEPGAVYEVVFKDQLSDLTWTSLGQVSNAGNALTFTNTMGTARQRFYQIKQVR
jgi:hypothetical protein